MMLVFFLVIITRSVLMEMNDIVMLSDLVNSYPQPSTINLFVCGRSADFFGHFKILSRNGVMVSFLNSDINKMISCPIPPNRAVFVFYLNCNRTNQIIKKANNLSLFSSPYRWILIDHIQNRSDIGELFEFISILTDSQVILANNTRGDNFELYEIYKRRKDSQILVNFVGDWTPTNGLTYMTAKNPVLKRNDLQRTVLNTSIVITNNDSLNHLTDKRDKHIDSIAKVNYVLMLHLADILNATFKYTVEQTWGYKDKITGEWSGMIGELVRKQADIGGTALFVTIDRVAIIDYIAMTTPTKSKFVFRAPKLSYETNVYFLPFHWSVWISMLFLIIIIGVALYVSVRWEWKIKDSTKTQIVSNETEFRDRWQDIILMEFGAFCQQATSTVPFSISGRIITIILFTSLMFLYTSYSATIVALLQSPSSKIKTLGDLLHSRMAVGVDDTVFNHFFFPNATEPIRRALYLQKVVPPGQKPRYFPMAEGVRRMREGLFAFHMETGAGYKIISETFQEDEKCGLHEISFLQLTDPYLAIQKNSSFKKLIAIGLRKLRESGLQHREVSLIYTSKPQCLSRGSSFVSVGIVDCYFAAVVFASGIILSTTIFIVELALNNRFLTIIKAKKYNVSPFPD